MPKIGVAVISQSNLIAAPDGRHVEQVINLGVPTFHPFQLSGVWWNRLFIPYASAAIKYRERFQMHITQSGEEFQRFFGPDPQAPKQIFAAKYDVYVFHSVNLPDPNFLYQMITTAKQAGKKFVLDIDDAYDLIPEWNHDAYLNYGKGSPEQMFDKLMREFVQMFDAITTTHELLAAHIRDYFKNCPRVYVCPNGINFKFTRRRLNNNRRPIVLYGGSTSHSGDFKLIEHLAPELGADAYFNVMGMKGDEAAGWNQRFSSRPGFYTETLGIMDPDIGLAPLLHEEFNTMKSNIKILEYGACGIPAICSKYGPYSNAPDDAVRFIHSNDREEWTQAVEEFIHQREMRDEYAKALEIWIRANYDMENLCDKWADMLIEITGKKIVVAR